MLFHSLVRSLSSKSSSQRSLSRHSLNQLANRFASVFASPVCELFVQCESKPATSDRTRPFGPPSPAPSPANWAIKAGDYRSRVLVCFCVINEVTALASTELHNSAAKFAAVRRSSSQLVAARVGRSGRLVIDRPPRHWPAAEVRNRQRIRTDQLVLQCAAHSRK